MAKLSVMADEMRRQCLELSKVHPQLFIVTQHKLPRGLCMSLTYTPGRVAPRWDLVLSRPKSAPSPKEVEICRDAFGVPQDVPAVAGLAISPTGIKRDTYKLSWVSGEQGRLL